MASATRKSLADLEDFTRNDWIMAGRIFSGLFTAVAVVWLLVALIGMRIMPPDEQLIRFNSDILKATDRYWRPKGAKTDLHKVEFVVVKPDGFKRYFGFGSCVFGHLMAADLVGRRAEIDMWGEALVALSISGRPCLRASDYRARHDRERLSLTASRPYLAMFALLSGLAFVGLMRMKLNPPTADKPQ